MPKSIAVALFLAVGLMAVPAQAFDIFALKVLGFSPDGRYFGFTTYAPLFETEKYSAETAVIDTTTDRFVPGAPLKISEPMKEDVPEEKAEDELNAFLTRAAKRGAKLVGQYKIGKPGAVLASVPDARITDYEHTPDKPPPPAGVATISNKHPALGELRLKLETRPIDWPRTSKLYAGKEAPGCAKEMDPEKGVIFRLTLEQGGRSIVLQDDKTLPASRNCVIGYGIVEVQAFDRPDGKVTLAVILGMHSRGFEGADRTFLAVTRVLER